MQAFGRSKVKNRDLPIQSPQCETKWLSHCKDMHKRNLKSIKPAIDNKWGVKRNGVTDSKRPTYSHLSSNAARARRDDERWREVEKENQHLLSKMARIMRSVPFDDSREFMPGIRLNPGSEPRMDTQIARVTYSRGAASDVVKRNQAFVSKLARENQLKRINMENAALVRRLQATEPAYPMDRLEEQRRETEQLLKSICHYPYRAGSWAKERRDKKHALELGDSIGVGAHGGLQMQPDASGMLTFEVVASDYTIGAGDYKVPLSGALPLTVNAGGKSGGALSFSSSPSKSSKGGFTVKPSKMGLSGKGASSPTARR